MRAVWLPVSLVLLFIFSCGISPAQDQKTGEMQHSVTSYSPGDLQWMNAPDVLPPGAKMAVLEGNPAAEGPFVVRIQFPANYKVMPHWHPMAERITVLDGEFMLGNGDTFDESQGKTYTAGSYLSIPPLMHHFASARKATTIQLNGMGPWQLYYLNPSDDPRGRMTRRGGKQ